MNAQDQEQLKSKGISAQQVEKQLSQFKSGFPYADIVRPATCGDGIARIDDAEAARLQSAYDAELAGGLDVLKFIPASGAATRMFKNMYEYKNADAQKQAQMDGEKPYKEFFERLGDFAFGSEITRRNPAGHAQVIDLMLDAEGLGYGQKPKGVILFHNYPDGPRTAAEEHIMEGLAYARNGNKVRLHYTVSPAHLDLFRAAVADRVARISKAEGVDIEITYSFQKPSTDTVAATMDNEPFRDADGRLVFRPAGHGALIENLNDLEADLIFIKNIDNVAQEHMLATTAKYKKVLAGYAVSMKKRIDTLLRGLATPTAASIADAQAFVTGEMKAALPSGFDAADVAGKAETLRTILDRPLRVCGMVKNEGEPGGGPFWVKGSDGRTTLQVVESAQIDPNDTGKMQIMKQSTHFNPVDLVCCTRDWQGRKYDLTKFVDHNAGFISFKSLNGKDLKAMELPGLWNGAMAYWNTFFVEVPIETFNPVKTVMDLLRKQHQPK